jgi:hypothetical protein
MAEIIDGFELLVMRPINLYVSYNLTNTNNNSTIGDVVANIVIDGSFHKQPYKE